MPKVSIAAKLAWLKEFGSPGDVLQQPLPELKRVSDEARPLKDVVEQKTIDGILSWTAQKGGKCVFFGDEDYPTVLYDRLADAPLVVFVRGDMSILGSDIVAFAGTPKPSRQGARRVDAFARDLARKGIVVAAGLSPGIAIKAIQGALAAKGRIVGVIGNQSTWEGLQLAEEVANKGLLISEFAPRTLGSDLGYAKKHRLLPALAQLLFLPEAPVDCDSLKLAGDAGDMGCEVAAVPADPSNERGRGCNSLLKDGVALVENTDDISALVGFAS